MPPVYGRVRSGAALPRASTLENMVLPLRRPPDWPGHTEVMNSPGRKATAVLAALLLPMALAACSADDKPAKTAAPKDTDSAALDKVVKIDGDRGLYVRCAGKGSPTVFMEGGDTDTSDSYGFAEGEIAKTTRTCVYDRANLGRSDPAPGPRGLADFVDDLEALLEKTPSPRSRMSSSVPPVAATSRPGTRTSTPTKSRAWSSSTWPLRSRTRPPRSSRRPTRTTRTTSRSATTSRWRRTPGQAAS